MLHLPSFQLFGAYFLRNEISMSKIVNVHLNEEDQLKKTQPGTILFGQCLFLIKQWRWPATLDTNQGGNVTLRNFTTTKRKTLSIQFVCYVKSWRKGKNKTESIPGLGHFEGSREIRKQMVSVCGRQRAMRIPCSAMGPRGPLFSGAHGTVRSGERQSKWDHILAGHTGPQRK